MDRGTYVATTGGMLQFRKLDIVNNNLANINTPGFKRQMLVGEVQTFDQTLASLTAKDDPFAKGDHERAPGTVNVRSITDYSLGPIKNTGNDLDVALTNPKDFFVVNTPSGPQYTRAGNFTLNTEGSLVTVDGQEVSGDGGAISVQGPGAKIAQDGSVLSNGLRVGKLQVVRIENPDNLERVGGARFTMKPGNPAPEQVEADVVTQSLEMSNVSAISSVIDLITTNKAFDMYTKSIQSIDAMNNTAIQQVGRSR
jgi:flagellar basal-body rod protein FlgF